MDSIINLIKLQIENHLPGEASHLPMSPLGRGRSSQLIQSVSEYKKSSVALILLEQKNDLNIVLTRRATYKGVHSNQISFPGGREESFDLSPIDTAIRETKEEIDFDLSNADRLGKLSDVFIPVSKFLVRPFVFHTDQELIYRNNREVVETFTLPINQLLDNRSVSTMKVEVLQGVFMDVPCFSVGEYQIWGATAIMLNELKEVVKNVYK